MSATIHIRVPDSLYIRDPEQSELGKKIVSRGVILLEKLGLEAFTFEKLAREIKSTEASIYRYFKSKHQFLGYLYAWYWSWLEWRISVATMNVDSPAEHLRAVIKILSEAVRDDPNVPHIDERFLHRVIVTESDRSLLTRASKAGERLGNFDAFESLCRRIGGFIRAYAPKFRFPAALTHTLVAATHRERFYAAHFPGATELKMQRDDSALQNYLDLLVFSVLDKSAPRRRRS